MGKGLLEAHSISDGYGIIDLGIQPAHVTMGGHMTQLQKNGLERI